MCGRLIENDLSVWEQPTNAVQSDIKALDRLKTDFLITKPNPTGYISVKEILILWCVNLEEGKVEYNWGECLVWLRQLSMRLTVYEFLLVFLQNGMVPHICNHNQANY